MRHTETFNSGLEINQQEVGNLNMKPSASFDTVVSDIENEERQTFVCFQTTRNLTEPCVFFLYRTISIKVAVINQVSALSSHCEMVWHSCIAKIVLMRSNYVMMHTMFPWSELRDILVP